MARIQNLKYAGKPHGIGSIMIQFDESGIAEVTEGVADQVKYIAGFRKLEDLPEMSQADDPALPGVEGPPGEGEIGRDLAELMELAKETEAVLKRKPVKKGK